MDDTVKRVVAEWVLTNGKLSGFEERLKATLDKWSIVDDAGMTVYRAQGNTFVPTSGDTPPDVLKDAVRPVIATSKTPESIKRYAGSECCIFKITLEPGVRYLDVNENARDIPNSVLDEVRKACSIGYFPNPTTPLAVLRKAILDRCEGRIKFSGKPKEEVIPPENEIMVYGLDGSFKDQKESAEKIEGKQTFEVTYGPTQKASSRGRTLRRTSKRRNKNGYRPPRKSKRHVRYGST